MSAVYMQHRCDDLAYGFGRDERMVEIVQVWGRIQSREYVKKVSETQVEQRVAYEVSVSKIEFLE